MAGAQLAGQLARLPFDGVTLDMQHGMMDFGDAAAMIASVTAAGKPAIVRVLWNDPGLVGQALDAGASAVIAPMVNSRAQAEALVKAAKYPPMGQRSWGGYTMVQTAQMTPGEYLATILPRGFTSFCAKGEPTTNNIRKSANIIFLDMIFNLRSYIRFNIFSMFF